MKPFIQTTFILLFLGVMIILIRTLMTVEEYKHQLDQKEQEYKDLKRDFLWYENAYLKCIYGIAEEDIELRLPPEYTTDY
jgi:hypothetical protein